MGRKKVDSISLVSQEISNIIRKYDKKSLRLVAIQAAEYALNKCGISHKDIRNGINALRKGSLGDCLERSKIKTLVDELDDRQFELREKASINKSFQEEFEKMWSQARAVSALYFAFETDPLKAANESLYESYHSTGNLDELREIVDSSKL